MGHFYYVGGLFFLLRCNKNSITPQIFWSKNNICMQKKKFWFVFAKLLVTSEGILRRLLSGVQRRMFSETKSVTENLERHFYGAVMQRQSVISQWSLQISCRTSFLLTATTTYNHSGKKRSFLQLSFSPQETIKYFQADKSKKMWILIQ